MLGRSTGRSKVVAFLSRLCPLKYQTPGSESAKAANPAFPPVIAAENSLARSFLSLFGLPSLGGSPPSLKFPSFDRHVRYLREEARPTARWSRVPRKRRTSSDFEMDPSAEETPNRVEIHASWK